MIIAMDGHNLVDLKTGTGTGGVYISTIPPCAHFLSKKTLFFWKAAIDDKENCLFVNC